jgi:hypothetical protein
MVKLKKYDSNSYFITCCVILVAYIMLLKIVTERVEMFESLSLKELEYLKIFKLLKRNKNSGHE